MACADAPSVNLLCPSYDFLDLKEIWLKVLASNLPRKVDAGPGRLNQGEDNGYLLHQFIGVTDRNRHIRAGKIF